MSRRWLLLALVCVLPSPVIASPSFAPHQLSLGLRYEALVPSVDPLQGVVGLSVGYDGYLGDGWVFEAVVTPALGWQNQYPLVFALGGRVGVRYLFLEESVRPWVGVSIIGQGLFRDFEPKAYAGLAASVGLEVFVAESIAVGARADAGGLLNTQGHWAFTPGATIFVATAF